MRWAFLSASVASTTRRNSAPLDDTAARGEISMTTQRSSPVDAAIASRGATPSLVLLSLWPCFTMEA